MVIKTTQTVNEGGVIIKMDDITQKNKTFTKVAKGTQTNTKRLRRSVYVCVYICMLDNKIAMECALAYLLILNL